MQTPPFEIEYLNKLYISRMGQLGVVLESTHPDSRDCMLNTRKEKTPRLYTGSDLANLRSASMISC